jgi:hypothetical protein
MTKRKNYGFEITDVRTEADQCTRYVLDTARHGRIDLGLTTSGTAFIEPREADSYYDWELMHAAMEYVTVGEPVQRHQFNLLFSH